jgi:hypothetical protein
MIARTIERLMCSSCTHVEERLRFEVTDQQGAALWKFIATRKHA